MFEKTGQQKRNHLAGPENIIRLAPLFSQALYPGNRSIHGVNRHAISGWTFHGQYIRFSL